jgi:hypothetical protein
MTDPHAVLLLVIRSVRTVIAWQYLMPFLGGYDKFITMVVRRRMQRKCMEQISLMKS